MGTPAFAVPVLERLLQAGHRVAGVFTRPDRPAGRGRRPTPPPVKVAALRHGLPVFQPPSLRRRPEAVDSLRALRPQVIVVAAYGLFLPPSVLDLPPLACLNIHPSLLPRYRGPSPVAAAILNGDATTGVSIIALDQGMDSGPIVAQRETPIEPGERADALTERLFRMGADLLVEVLPAWARGQITPKPQDESKATVTSLLRREDGLARWERPAHYLERQLRAYHPWPGLFTRWEGRTLKILEAEARAGESDAEPGTVLPWGEGGAAVATGEGLLVLERLQLEGRRPLDIGPFLQGHRGFLGARLG